LSESTPAMDGFRMPAEWQPHACCWMAWPCRLGLWGTGFEAACRAYALVARTIAEFEPVRVLAPPPFVAMATLQLARQAEVVAMELDDSWTRDSGPCFVIDAEGRLAGVAWRFNGWGNRYHPHAHDAALAAALLADLGLPCYKAPMVLEGGAIHVDGQGTVLVSEPSVLNVNRNPTLDRRQIEERLVLYLGVRKIIWLEHGLVDDDTDGHVDNVARFVAPGTAMCAVASHPDDPNRGPLSENRLRLAQARDAQGRALEVVELPLPAPRQGPKGLLPLSYLNFYIANGAVLVPAFDDPMDGAAREIVAAAFPDRHVAQLPALDIVRGGGGIHCITQQQPRA
jgi:agmatine deiminase